MTRPIVAVDVDGVLADLHPLIRMVADKLGFGHKLPDPIPKYEVDEYFTKDENAALWSRVGEIGCADLPLFEGTVEGMARLAEVAEVHIITSPLSSGMRWTHQRDNWLLRHFGIKHFQVGHIHAKHLVMVDMLIDDAPKNVTAWGRKHKGYAVNWTRPYNEAHEYPADIHNLVRTNSWEHVRELAQCSRHVAGGGVVA